MSKKEKVVLGMGLKSLLEEKEEEDLKLSSLHEDELDLASGLHGERGDETDVDVTGASAADAAAADAEQETEEPQEPEEVLLVLDDSEETEPETNPETNDAPAAAQVEAVVETPAVVETTTVIEDVEILQSFIQESRDHLENIEEKILKLEATNDSDVVNDIFRSMHTMKGTSAFFGFVDIKELSHALESVLDDLRADKISVNAELVDILLDGTDMLSKMLGYLNSIVQENRDKKGKLEIPGSGIDLAPILSRIGQVENEPEAPTPEQKPSTGIEDLVTDEMREKFVAESRDLLDATEKDILELEKRPDDRSLIDDAFRFIHTIKGNSGFLGYSRFEAICMDMESVLDSIRSGERKAGPKVVTLLLNTIDSMRQTLESLGGADDPESGAAGDPADAYEEQPEYKPIGEILIEMGETTPEEVDSALDLQEKRVGEILVTEGKVSEEALENALKSQVKAGAEKAEGTAYTVERKDIRVEMGKLDKLFDLMGELITAEAMVVHNPELEGLELEGFNRAGSYLAKITREMQEITMTVRMIPLEGLFNKMRRLVRDLARKFGRQERQIIIRRNR